MDFTQILRPPSQRIAARMTLASVAMWGSPAGMRTRREPWQGPRSRGGPQC